MSRVEHWRGGVQGVRGPAVSPRFGRVSPSSGPSLRLQHPLIKPDVTISVIRLSDRVHQVASGGPAQSCVQLIQPGLLEESRGELSESLAPALVLSPQEVHQLAVDIRVHLLEVPMGVADAEVLTPAPENRVEHPNLVGETGNVVVPHRLAALLAHALPRPRGRPPTAEERKS